MKIYFILPDLSAGGAERVSITIARLLSKEGFEVEFINLGFNEGEMLKWIQPEFNVVSFRCRRVLMAIPQLYHFIKEHPNDFYFASREHVNVIALLCAMMTKGEIIVRIPNMPQNVLVSGISGFRMYIVKILNKFLLNFAKLIIAQNEEMRKQLLHYYSLPSYKVVTINNPVDRDYIISATRGSSNPFNCNETNFLCICNISYSKGIDILQRAWLIVKSKIPNAHMYIIGRNNSLYANKIIEDSKKLIDFTFLGFQSNPYPFIKYCDAFVLSSRMEGFPNVILEALCLNKPVACTTCVEVIKEIIQNGKNGYYCNIEDSEALAECMIKSIKLKNINNNYLLFNKEILINCFKK